MLKVLPQLQWWTAPAEVEVPAEAACPCQGRAVGRQPSGAPLRWGYCCLLQETVRQHAAASRLPTGSVTHQTDLQAIHDVKQVHGKLVQEGR